MKWAVILALVIGILSSFPSNAQEAPTRLVTRTNTTYFRDGSAQGRTATFFEVEGIPGEQPLGFLGRRLEEHLNPNPAVQGKFKNYQNLQMASSSLAIAFTMTALQSALQDETPHMEVQEGGTLTEIWWGYKWPIVTGIGYLVSGIAAGKSLTATVELHNSLLSKTPKDDFGALPNVQFQAGWLLANQDSTGGPGLRLIW